jgi:hypothetical protein
MVNNFHLLDNHYRFCFRETRKGEFVQCEAFNIKLEVIEDMREF